MPNSTLENKIDLLLSLHQDQNKRLKALEERIDPNRKEKDKKWISCSELGKVIDNALKSRIGDNYEQSEQWKKLIKHFRQATILEVKFWEMGLHGE